MADANFAQIFRTLSDQLGNLGLSELVPVFDGESAKFKDWVKAINKCAVVNNLPDTRKKVIAYRFSSGVVSEFIQRYLTDSQDATWDQMKDELSKRFGDVSDAYHQFSILRNIKQRRAENVQNFAERIVSLA